MLPPSRSMSRFLSPNLWFALILASLCAWVFSLPVFPTQDGPMHRYYVHVLDSLLHHQATYSVYRIRHPFPPYLTQYGSLLVLYHLFSYDFAEKLFTCLVLVCLALGLRFAAEGVGPTGRWLSLLFPPILFSWPLFMGFYNYMLGIGLFLLCMGFWQRLPIARGWAHLLGFVFFVAVLAVTHPVPMLLLIAFSGFDLLLSVFFRSSTSPFSAWFRQYRLQVAAFMLTLLAASYPMLAVDGSKTQHTLSLIRFNRPFFTTTLLLTGISPYNSRALDPWINGYRLCLYAIFASGMWFGGKAALRALRKRQPDLGTTAFLGAVLLALAVSFLPNDVNGSWYFSTRLVFVLWVGAILAASASPLPPVSRRPWLILAGVVCCAFTLAPAQKFIRPGALALQAAEKIQIPQGVPGALLIGVDPNTEQLRLRDQLAFNPYQWGGVLPFVREDVVALDTPWLDQKISPLEAVPASPELITDIADARVRTDSPDSPAVHGRCLPAWGEARIVRDASFMVLMARPEELAQGLARQLTPDEQAKYSCERPQSRYMVCTSGVRLGSR